MGKEYALSLIMIIDKLTENEGLSSLKNLPEDYLKNLEQKTPKDLIEVVRNIIDLLMIRINVPDDERKELTDKVLERRLSDMFAWADNMDIQEERKKTEAAEKRIKELEEAEKVSAIERQKAEAAEGRVKELEAELLALQKRFQLQRENQSV